MTAPLRVLVADDQALIRTGFATIIAAQPDMEVVGECGDGRTAVAMAERLRPDVVVMDVRMPKLDGIQATAALRRTLPDVKVLVITSFDEDGAVRDALRAGANGFLLKDTSPAGLVEALRAVMQGTSVVSPGPITSLLLNDKRATRPSPAPELGLSPRELEILRLLCAAYSNTEIAEELFVSESTVKTHVSAIMTKMGVQSRLKAVVRAYELGLVEHS